LYDSLTSINHLKMMTEDLAKDVKIEEKKIILELA
jgi:hypothetical protein